MDNSLFPQAFPQLGTPKAYPFLRTPSVFSHVYRVNRRSGVVIPAEIGTPPGLPKPLLLPCVPNSASRRPSPFHLRTQFCAAAFENRLFGARCPEAYPFLRRTQFCEPAFRITRHQKRTRFCVPAATSLSSSRTRFCDIEAGRPAHRILFFLLYIRLISKASACTQKKQISKRTFAGVPVSAYASDRAVAGTGICCGHQSGVRTRFCGRDRAERGAMRTHFCGKKTNSFLGKDFGRGGDGECGRGPA